MCGLYVVLFHPRLLTPSFWSFLRTLFPSFPSSWSSWWRWSWCVAVVVMSLLVGFEPMIKHARNTNKHTHRLAEAHSEELLALVTQTEDEVRASVQQLRAAEDAGERAELREIFAEEAEAAAAAARREENQRHFDALLGITDHDDDGTTTAARRHQTRDTSRSTE